MILSLYDLLKHSVHNCTEVFPDRFLQLRDALLPLRHYGERAPYMAFVERWLEFHTGGDPLAMGGRLITHTMWSACGVPGAPGIGMGLWHELWPEALVQLPADPAYLVDDSDRTFGVEWDQDPPWLPFKMFDAANLLDAYPWECEAFLDEVEPFVRQWLANEETYGERTDMDVDAYYRSIVDEYRLGFDVARDAFKDGLERAAERGNAVVVSFSENLSI